MIILETAVRDTVEMYCVILRGIFYYLSLNTALITKIFGPGIKHKRGLQLCGWVPPAPVELNCSESHEIIILQQHGHSQREIRKQTGYSGCGISAVR